MCRFDNSCFNNKFQELYEGHSKQLCRIVEYCNMTKKLLAKNFYKILNQQIPFAGSKLLMYNCPDWAKAKFKFSPIDTKIPVRNKINKK